MRHHAAGMRPGAPGPADGRVAGEFADEAAGGSVDSRVRRR
jgi:hypothetical protein